MPKLTYCISQYKHNIYRQVVLPICTCTHYPSYCHFEVLVMKKVIMYKCVYAG